jgi:ADP-ribose pyrophosphatase YjhB (NUDIX family)
MAYVPSGEEEAAFLRNFDPSKYKNPAVAADTALFAADGDALKVLLIRRGGFPYKGCWALPGGFVNIDEDVRLSAQRELLEETGLSGIYIEQAFVWGAPGRDPRQRVITVSYIGLAPFDQLHASAGDDAVQADWFAIEKYTETEETGVVMARYVLRGGETLSPAVSYPSGRMQEITRVQSGGLAFDHAESIAFSLNTLRKRALSGRFLEFALESEAERERARRAIERVFQLIRFAQILLERLS